MTNAITEAYSMEKVVEVINTSKNGESPSYFGGADTREAEVMAGQYAWEAAKDSGFTDDASIEAHLTFLADAGADFNFSSALDDAFNRKNQ